MVIKPGSAPTRAFNSLQRAALRILRRFGTDAHVYTAGANGAMVNLLQTGNYILSDGSTGYSAVDGPAGLVLDGAGSVGGELVTNGDFSSGTTGWTGFGAGGWAVSGGAATHTAGTYGVFRSTTCAVSTGNTYIVTFDVTLSAGDVKCYIAGAASPTFTTSGTKQAVIVAGANLTYTIAIEPSTPFAGTVDNISVKQVTGIHATQATTANKPTERRGLYNQFKYANVSSGIGTDYNGTFGGVGSNGVLTANYGLAPDGTMTAARAQLSLNGGTTTADRSGITGVGAPIDSLVRTMAVYLKSLSGSPTVLTRVHNSVVYTTLNTSTWTMVPVSGSSGADPTTNLVEIRGGQTPTNSNTADVLVWGAGLFTGTLTAQQILDSGGIPLTTSAAASNTSAGRYSWSFDGGDFLDQGSIPFQQADDRAVIVAFNASSAGIVYDVSGGVGIPLVGRIQLDGGGGLHAFFRDDASTLVDMSFALGFNVPVVVSYRVVSGVRVLRVNGVQRATNSTVLGATTVNIARIGAAAVTTPAAWITGNISQVLPLKGTFTDAEMLTMERECASTLPNAPSF